MKPTSLAQAAAAAALACTLSLTAVAAPTSQGVTTSDLASALRAGLNVEADREKPDLLFVQGKNHTIGVWGNACEEGSRCKGVTYLSVLKVAPSKESANKYNSEGNYSKIYINPEGKAFLVIDQVVWGGVSSENILNNALILMAETSSYLEGSGTIASVQPQSNSANLSTDLGKALGRQWLGNFQNTQLPLRPDFETRTLLKASAAERR